MHRRTPGYKWSLLKVREGKYKLEHASLLQVLLKPKQIYGKGGTR
jgi:hypothetical protein